MSASGASGRSGPGGAPGAPGAPFAGDACQHRPDPGASSQPRCVASVRPGYSGPSLIRLIRLIGLIRLVCLACLVEAAGLPASALADGPPVSPPSSTTPASARPAGNPRPGPDEGSKALARQIVQIMADLGNGRTGLGSGVPIGRNLVVTNCHVTRGAHSISVLARTVADPEPIDVEAQAADPDHDLCILRTRWPLPVEPVRTAAVAPRPGDRVTGIGYTGGLRLRIHPGEVIALYAHDGGDIVRSSTAFDLGASGGGLFNAANELIGILTFRARVSGANYFSLPVTWIRDLMAREVFRRVTPLPASTLAFWERPADEQPAFLQALVKEAVDRGRSRPGSGARPTGP